MKKKIILLAIILVIFLVLLFLLLIKKEVPKNLVCSGEDTLIMTNANVKYTFSGEDDIAYKQQMDVKVYAEDESLLNNYKNIIMGNFDCMNIEVDDLVLSYTCKYDLSKNKYYEELEKDGVLYYKDLKEYFENNNFVCEYVNAGD